MKTINKIDSLKRCGYNFDALKYFLENAYELEVIDMFVIRESLGYRPNKDLVVKCKFPACELIYVLYKDEDESCWKFHYVNTLNPEKANIISNPVMKAIYPVDSKKVSKYDIVKKVDAAVASGKINNDPLYIENLCEVIEVDEAYGYEIDGAKMMERDLSILSSFASDYASANSDDANYRYDMMKNTDISDDDKNELMLATMGLASGVNAEALEAERAMKEITKDIAKNSGVSTREGVTYTFKSNGCTFKTFLN